MYLSRTVIIIFYQSKHFLNTNKHFFNTIELDKYLPSLPDIDECDTGEHLCHVNATCTNTDGSYDCDCKNGFTGDGHNCSSMISAN